MALLDFFDEGFNRQWFFFHARRHEMAVIVRNEGMFQLDDQSVSFSSIEFRCLHIESHFTVFPAHVDFICDVLIGWYPVQIRINPVFNLLVCRVG